LCVAITSAALGIKVNLPALSGTDGPVLADAATLPAPAADPKSAVVLKLACKKKDCTGFCIRVCDLMIIDDYEGFDDIPLQPNQGGGTFTHTSENDRLKLTLQKNALGSGFAENYLRGGVFQLEEDYELPSDLNQALEFTQPYTIRKGDYPYTEFSDRYEINL
jgi:hypothetical protein